MKPHQLSSKHLRSSAISHHCETACWPQRNKGKTADHMSVSFLEVTVGEVLRTMCRSRTKICSIQLQTLMCFGLTSSFGFFWLYSPWIYSRAPNLKSQQPICSGGTLELPEASGKKNIALNSLCLYSPRRYVILGKPFFSHGSSSVFNPCSPKLCSPHTGV